MLWCILCMLAVANSYIKITTVGYYINRPTFRHTIRSCSNLHFKTQACMPMQLSNKTIPTCAPWVRVYIHTNETWPVHFHLQWVEARPCQVLDVHLKETPLSFTSHYQGWRFTCRWFIKNTFHRVKNIKFVLGGYRLSTLCPLSAFSTVQYFTNLFCIFVSYSISSLVGSKAHNSLDICRVI